LKKELKIYIAVAVEAEGVYEHMQTVQGWGGT